MFLLCGLPVGHLRVLVPAMLPLMPLSRAQPGLPCPSSDRAFCPPGLGEGGASSQHLVSITPACVSSSLCCSRPRESCLCLRLCPTPTPILGAPSDCPLGTENEPTFSSRLTHVLPHPPHLHSSPDVGNTVSNLPADVDHTHLA